MEQGEEQGEEQAQHLQGSYAWPGWEELGALIPPSACQLLSVLLQGMGLR